jgi:hypothetical protein
VKFRLLEEAFMAWLILVVAGIVEILMAIALK